MLELLSDVNVVEGFIAVVLTFLGIDRGAFLYQRHRNGVKENPTELFGNPITFQDFVSKFEDLYEWHAREDPDKPGWKIWWVSSKDQEHLIEVLDRVVVALEKNTEKLDSLIDQRVS